MDDGEWMMENEELQTTGRSIRRGVQRGGSCVFIVLLFAFIFHSSYFVFPCAAQEKLDVSGLIDEPEKTPAAAIPAAPALEAAEQNAVEQEAADAPAPKNRKSILALIHAGGSIGYVIILLSLIAAALVIEHCLTLRQKTVMPPGFADEVVQQLTQGQLAAAITLCRKNPSVLAQILAAAMPQYEFGWEAVEKSAEESAAEQAAKLYRKVEYLNVIGNIAPMLGLLGTVVGMVFAFQQLAESGGYAKAADLAEGIYLALITTVQGLTVAIPALAAYSFFNSRIAALMNETTFIAEQILRPIKKSLAKRN